MPSAQTAHAIVPVARWNFVYPLGFLGIGFVDTLFSQWIVYLHAPPGISPGHQVRSIGTVLLISYLLQGLLNPLLGPLSDRLRHRLGPRLPLIQIASLPMALSFFQLWRTTAFWPSLGLICAYGLLFVMVVQPYMALLPALADSRQRVRYSLIGGVLSLVASGAALIVGPQLIADGDFWIFGLAGCLALVVTVFLPSLLLREIHPQPRPPAMPLLRQLREVAGLNGLGRFLLGNACVILTILTLTMLSPYLCETLLGQSRSYTSTINFSAFAGVLLAVGYVAWRGARQSFVRLMQRLALADGLLLVILALLSLKFQLPLLLWQGAFLLLGCLIFIGMMAPNLVLAEFSDRDPQQRRGAIFGLNGLTVNCANAAAAKATAGLLSLGKSVQAPLGVQSALLFAGGTALVASWILAGIRLEPDPKQGETA